MLCINIMESIRIKIVSLISLGSNKVCVVMFNKLILIFLNYVYLNLKKKIIKKMKNANDQNFFNFVGGGLRQRVIRYSNYELKKSPFMAISGTRKNYKSILKFPLY